MPSAPLTRNHPPVPLLLLGDFDPGHGGGFCGGRQGNSYRNPVVAEAMKALGYVNRFGYGIQRAQAALRDNGNPPAEFEIDDKVFLAIVRKRPE